MRETKGSQSPWAHGRHQGTKEPGVKGQAGHKQQKRDPWTRQTQPQGRSPMWVPKLGEFGVGPGGGRGPFPYQVTVYKDLQLSSKSWKSVRTLESMVTQPCVQSSKDVCAKCQNPNKSRPEPTPPSLPRAAPSAQPRAAAPCLHGSQNPTVFCVLHLSYRKPPPSLVHKPTSGRPQAPNLTSEACAYKQHAPASSHLLDHLTAPGATPAVRT